MARLRISTPSVAGRDSTRLNRGSSTARFVPRDSPSLDQENSDPSSSNRSKNAPLSSHSSIATHNSRPSPRPAPRRMLAERASAGRRRDESEEEEEDEEQGDQNAPAAQPAKEVDTDDELYNPKQTVEERQQLRKKMRELNAEAHDNQNEWLQGTGLHDALVRSNEYFKEVKQTSDAVIDSRFLVTAGDIAYKKTTQLIMGDNSQGIDVDEFVGKCITFMKDSAGPSSRAQHDDEDMDSEYDGDALNWEALGMQVTFVANSRPPLPSFLLGPLSLQKRQRAAIRRTARQNRATLRGEETRPTEITRADLGDKSDAGLTSQCSDLHNRIKSAVDGGTELYNQYTEENVPQDEILKHLKDYGIADNGELWLFHAVMNAKSFGQTVENMFYLSFLIRDGLVGVDFDSQGLPTIRDTSETDPAEQERQRARAQKHQGILTIDHDTWEELIDLLDLRGDEPLMPDRTELEQKELENVTGWYQ